MERAPRTQLRVLDDFDLSLLGPADTSTTFSLAMMESLDIPLHHPLSPLMDFLEPAQLVQGVRSVHLTNTMSPTTAVSQCPPMSTLSLGTSVSVPQCPSVPPSHTHKTHKGPAVLTCSSCNYKSNYYVQRHTKQPYFDRHGDLQVTKPQQFCKRSNFWTEVLHGYQLVSQCPSTPTSQYPSIPATLPATQCPCVPMPQYPTASEPQPPSVSVPVSKCP